MHKASAASFQPPASRENKKSGVRSLLVGSKQKEEIQSTKHQILNEIQNPKAKIQNKVWETGIWSFGFRGFTIDSLAPSSKLINLSTVNRQLVQLVSNNELRIPNNE